jgi:hypothetical protein
VVLEVLLGKTRKITFLGPQVFGGVVLKDIENDEFPNEKAVFGGLCFSPPGI